MPAPLMPPPMMAISNSAMRVLGPALEGAAAGAADGRNVNWRLLTSIKAADFGPDLPYRHSLAISGRSLRDVHVPDRQEFPECPPPASWSSKATRRPPC